VPTKRIRKVEKKKASDFSGAFVLVAGSVEISNQIIADYYAIFALAS